MKPGIPAVRIARDAQEDSERPRMDSMPTEHIFHTQRSLDFKAIARDALEDQDSILDTWQWGQMASVTIKGEISLEAYRLIAGLTSRRSRRNREATPIFDGVVSAYEN